MAESLLPSVRWPDHVRRGAAATLAFAGLMKVGGATIMKRQFAEWGYSDQLRRAVGVTELVTSALIVSGHRAPATGLLGILMSGAAATHLKTSGERMLAPLPLGFLAAYIAAAQKQQR